MNRIFSTAALAIFFYFTQLSVLSSQSLTRADTLNIIHYDIHLDIMNFSAKQIKGYTEVTLTPRVNNLNSIKFDLLKMTLDSVIISNDQSIALSVIQLSYNDTLLKINLNKAININDTARLKIYYHGQPKLDPSKNKWGGFFFTTYYVYNLGVGMQSNPHPIGRFWFPCLDDFRSRSMYDFFIRTESTHTAVCNGTLVKVTDNGDNTKTFHWNLRNTVPTYLASVAVAGYGVINDTYKGIEKNIPIQIYVSPADTNKTKASFINLKKALRIFENDFGPYEWERVGYVGVPFLYGAMEHATNIAYPLAFVTGTLDYETLFAHELSHHWFGDLVTCSSAEDIWLNEGLACYCESVFTEGLYGKVSFKNYQRNTHKTALQSAYLLDKGYRALYGIPAEYTYGTTVYDKGADVVHTLRNYLGDSLFFKTVKAYMKQYAFQNVTTSDFENYISAKTSVNLTDFFNTWVYGKGFPHFSIDSFNIRHKTQDTSIKNFDAEVYVRQRLRGMDVFAKSNKLEITFMSNDWKSYTDTIVFSGEFGNKIFHVSFPPDFVMVDKEEKVADATTDNYKVIKAKGTYDFADTYFKLIVNNVSDSAFVRVEHNWIAPDKMKKTNKDIKRLSDSRYWKIDGIFPNGMATKASFYFTRSTDSTYGYLDNFILKDIRSSDSLLLLYRKNTAEDWRMITFTKTGSFNNGYILTDNIQPGEYCFGIGKPFQDVNEVKGKNSLFKIFPNPGKEIFSIEYDIHSDGIINIYNMKGMRVDSIIAGKGHKKISWNSKTFSNGTYLVELTTADNGLVLSKTIIKN